jgi:hypothetical protein
MSKSRHPEIRAALRQHADGLTLSELAKLLGIGTETLRPSIRSMPDVYIDRWLPPKRGLEFAAVYCAVVVPEDCPKPERSK